MKAITIEEQYQLYLQRMGLSEDNMHPEQKKQLKNTFFGAFGQAISVFRDEITQLEDDKAVEAMQSLWEQVGHFFMKKSGTLN